MACSSPTGLDSTEETTLIGVACSGPTGLEKKKGKGLLPEGWRQQDENHTSAGWKQQVGVEDLLDIEIEDQKDKIREGRKEEEEKKRDQHIAKGPVHGEMGRQGGIYRVERLLTTSGDFPHCVPQYFHQKRLPNGKCTH